MFGLVLRTSLQFANIWGSHPRRAIHHLRPRRIIVRVDPGLEPTPAWKM